MRKLGGLRLRLALLAVVVLGAASALARPALVQPPDRVADVVEALPEVATATAAPVHKHHSLKRRVREFPHSRGVIAAAHYLSQRAGEDAFAVYDNRHKLSGLNTRTRFHTASVVKSMLLVAYLQTLAAEHRGLDGESTELLYPMIHSSDNDAASAIFAIVGESGLERVAREAHMRDFEPSVAWGFTEVSAADLARFFYIQDRLIPRRFDGYARWLFSHIEPSESWGIPVATRPAGFETFFKGGWLPEIEGLVNQVARLERGRDTFAMAVLTRDDPSMGYGEETLTGVAARLVHGG